LVIDNINFPEIDQVFYLLGVLKSVNGLCLGIDEIRITPYDDPTNFRFDGQPINASGVNGYYEVWISISTNPDFHDANLVLIYITTQSYNANDFEETSVIIVGFSDAGYDVNGDDLFEFIIFEVTIEVQHEGQYYLTLLLESNNPYSLKTAKITGSWDGFLNTGLETVEIYIHVTSLYSTIYSTKLNGSLSVDMAYIHEASWSWQKYHHFIIDAYNTSFYHFSQFSPPSIYLTGNYNDRGYDTDADGLFNLLIIDVEFYVTMSMIVDIQFELSTAEGGNSLNEIVRRDLEVGIHTLSVTFNAVAEFSLYSQQLDSSYWINKIEVSDEWSEVSLIHFPYVTRVYNYTEFDPPPAFLTGNYYSREFDTNADGLINLLAIKAELNVTISDTYSVGIHLGPVKENDGFYQSFEVYYGVGIYNLTFPFECSPFFISRLNTSYRISYITFGFSQVVIDPFFTRVYNYTEFDPPAAYIVRALDEWAQDTDGDGLFNQLIIEVEINVTRTGSYVIGAALESTIEEPKDHYTGSVDGYFSIGIHTQAIPFNISSYIFKLNTSYELAEQDTNVWIKEQNNVIDEVYLSYITRTYNYTEFDGPGALLTGNYNDRGLDINGDGRFDRLAIDVEVNFTTPGYYQIKLEVSSYARKDISIEGLIYGYWELGVRNVSIQFTTYYFYTSMINSVYTIENVSIYDSRRYCLEWVGHPYSTRIYNFTEFDVGLIHIDGNSEFSILVQAENWKGDGSRSNPYIIEGLSLKGINYEEPKPREGDLIQILNTNNYFTITNCSLTGGEVGIYLSNVMNGNISQNTIKDNWTGILLEFADNNSITHNTVKENSFGIVIGTYNPVEPILAHCNNNSIINNLILDSDLMGLIIGLDSVDNIVKWNDFRSSAVSDHNSTNIFIENYWYEWAENESTAIPLVGNHDINPQTSPNHLSKPIVLFPNWGETLISKVLIDWIPAQDKLGHAITYSIYYSADNGTTWNLLVSELTNTNYQWEFQNITFGSLYLIKVIVYDSLGFFSFDISDHPFTIRSPPQPPSTLPFRFVVLLVLFSFLLILLKRRS
ncbi:MAG: NosD domain-containing protein, partial [Candidatus Hodarchaeota archaeon]